MQTIPVEGAKVREAPALRLLGRPGRRAASPHGGRISAFAIRSCQQYIMINSSGSHRGKKHCRHMPFAINTV